MRIQVLLDKKENGFTLIYLIIGIGIIVLFSGTLYFWHIKVAQGPVFSVKKITGPKIPEKEIGETSKAEKETKTSERTQKQSSERSVQEESEKQTESPAGIQKQSETELRTSQTETSQYQRKDISFLKFVSSENCFYLLDDTEVSQLRSLNVNGIRICPGYSVLTDGSIREDIPESWIVQLIERAHQAGFAVFLEPNFAGPQGFPNLSDPEYIDRLYNIVLDWAKIAERENVEFYSPLNEPNATFSSLDLVNQWINKTQDLRQFFSGNLVLKLADLGPENIESITGYDYLAFDIMWGDSRYNELKDYLNLAINKGNNLTQEYNLKGFFFGELGAERSMVSKDVQAEIFRTILEETWGKVDGYCFLGWSNLEFKFKDNEKAKSIIKGWYSKK